MKTVVLTLLLAIGTNATPASQHHRQKLCRTVPTSSAWPGDSEWDNLNTKLGGRLIHSKPPAIVCDPGRSALYDKDACEAVGASWGNASFADSDPATVYYPNYQKEACLPTAIYSKSSKCDIKPFARYVVNATESCHVAEAVKFARRTGVRLSIKNTGHCFLGRSAAPGLSIWTRHIRGIELHSKFMPGGCESCEPMSAMKVSAGHIMADVYSFGKKHGVVVVGGADGTVGLGGYLLGGGHSPISGKFGLAVDNVLEMEVVTPNGDTVTANKYQHSDLFWALRGGGGSTFGALISATLRTYPVFPATVVTLIFSSTKEEASKNNNAAFFSTLAFMHTLIPTLSDNNVTGYYGFGPESSLATAGYKKRSSTQERQSLTWSGYALNHNEAFLRRLLDPLMKKLDAASGLKSSIEFSHEDNVYGFIGHNKKDAFESSTRGYNLAMGSRLWDKQALTNPDKLEPILRLITKTSMAQGLMVTGPGVRRAPNAGDTSVTPAWRKSYLHITTGTTWPPRDTTARDTARNFLNMATKSLRDMAPNMGAYFNEADVEEPSFQKTFWGENYPRLHRIKEKYDPDGVFYCSACVGSEKWVVQESGEVCKR